MNRSGALARALLAALALALALGPAARANGAPVRVVLGYLEGITTWGPRGATGVAEVTLGEGRVTLTATGLAVLAGQQYEGWLVNSRTGAAFAVGRFDAQPDGTAAFERVGAPIPDQEYDLVLVTVADAGVPSDQPGDRVALAGFFPVLRPEQPTAWPAELPYTGPEGGALLLPGLALGLGFGLGFAAGRRWPGRPRPEGAGR